MCTDDSAGRVNLFHGCETVRWMATQRRVVTTMRVGKSHGHSVARMHIVSNKSLSFCVNYGINLKRPSAIRDPSQPRMRRAEAFIAACQSVAAPSSRQP